MKRIEKKKELTWRRLAKTERERLRCLPCNNPLLEVRYGRVARKVRRRGANLKRLIARCPMCKREKTISRGARSQ